MSNKKEKTEGQEIPNEEPKKKSLPVKSVTEEIIDGESMLTVSAEDITVKISAVTLAKKYGGSFALRDVRKELNDENRNAENVYMFTDFVKEHESSGKTNKKVKEALDTARQAMRTELEKNGLPEETIQTILSNAFKA